MSEHSEGRNERIDRIVEGINPLGFGITVAVFREEHMIFGKGYGLRDRGLPDVYTGTDFFGVEPLDRRLGLPRGQFPSGVDTIYELGSVSKQFTAAAVLLLQEQGALKTGDLVARYVSELTVPAGITLDHLLHHESGIADYNSFPRFADAYKEFRASGDRDFAAVLAELASIPPAFAPGAEYMYSNSDYLLLGIVVSRVSGLPLGEFLDRHIFQPLGMLHTRQDYPRQGSTDVALGYVADGQEVRRDYQWDLAWTAGAGGLTSTVVDLGRWDRALQQPGLFGPRLLGQMFTPAREGYACGWVVGSYRGERYVWHNGGVGGFHTMNALFPDRETAVILLSNNVDFMPQLENAAPAIFDVVTGG